MLSFFPQAVLDEVWDLIDSVSGDFPTYSSFRFNCYKSNFAAIKNFDVDRPVLSMNNGYF